MKISLHLLLAFALFLNSNGQYISRSQPVPYACPNVCPGSTIVLTIPQVQNLGNGDTLLALISNASGSFGSGTTSLPSQRYSTNMGTNWTNGAYRYSTNVNDLYFEIKIPNNFPVGTNYTIKMKSSSGYTSGDLFQCSGGNYFTVSSAYTTIAPVTAGTYGTTEWYGHVYTWVPTTGQALTTVPLVSAQNFFDANNYLGHFVKNNLSFDIDYNAAAGGSCPGAPGTLNDGTSIPCSKGANSNFSIRMMRRYNFPAGTYKLEIQGDDGIRLSMDGGNTWLLSSYFEQTYNNGYQSTATAYPNGICLSGPTDLIIEFFQRNVDARFTFKSTLLSTNSVSNAGNQSACAGGNVSFALSTTGTNLTYQWFYSTDGGTSYNPVPNSAPFSGVTSSTLTVTGVPANYNNYLFRCQITGLCGNPVNTPVDTLFIGGAGNQTITADKDTICPNDSATICAPAGATGYLWNTGATTQCIQTSLAGNYYATVTYGTGCSGPSNRIAIMVRPSPTVSITKQGDTLSVLSGISWQWYEGDNPVPGATGRVFVASHSGSYSVMVTDASGCKSRSTPIDINNTGINELSAAAAFEIYPNPVGTDGIVHVLVSPAFIGMNLEAYDVTGKRIISTTLNQTDTEINLSLCSRGIYFLKAGVTTRKVLVNQ